MQNIFNYAICSKQNMFYILYGACLFFIILILIVFISLLFCLCLHLPFLIFLSCSSSFPSPFSPLVCCFLFSSPLIHLFLFTCSSFRLPPPCPLLYSSFLVCRPPYSSASSILFLPFSLSSPSSTSPPPPPGGGGPAGGADPAGSDREEGVGAADRGDGGEGAGSPGSHRSSAGRQRLHQREARRPAGYTHIHTHTNTRRCLYLLLYLWGPSLT